MNDGIAPARRAGWVKYGLAAAAVVVALGVAAGLAGRGAPRVGNPLAGHLLPAPVRFEGRVVERLDAGSYVYLRVSRAGAADTWVVALRSRASIGDRVRIDAVGRAEGFHSKRLGRDFAELFFAAVRAAA